MHIKSHLPRKAKMIYNLECRETLVSCCFLESKLLFIILVKASIHMLALYCYATGVYYLNNSCCPFE